MNYETLNESIFFVRIPYKDIFTTVYLVKTDEGALLFDTATDEGDVSKYILPMLSALGVTDAELKYVFISHKHADHSGGLDALLAAFPSLCVVSRSVFLRARYGKGRFLFPEDGDTLLRMLRVVTVPGHTFDSEALLDTRTGTLISGDCLQLYGILGSGDWAAHINFPKEHRRAIEKLRTLKIERIAAAHLYEPYGQLCEGRDAVSAALDACLLPLDGIERLIRENPALDDEAVRALYNATPNAPTVAEKIVTAVRRDMTDAFTELKVISFNIRFCDDKDGHTIPERAPRLASLTEPYDADVIGFQEYTPAWEEEIEHFFGEKYEIFNKYRAESNHEGGPILWKKDRFDCLTRGWFWLSDTPEVESRGWDELYNCYRICLYAVLRDKRSGKCFTVMNTHFGFGDRGQTASAELIAAYAKRISAYPTFITGDFNMTPASPGYEEMTSHFIDANAVTAKDFRDTYHAYDPTKERDQHIDYCFVTPAIAPLSHEIIDGRVEGKYPSDHFGLFFRLGI